MPVDTTHDQYDENSHIWQKCRDVRKGEDAIKRRCLGYAPIAGEISAVAYEDFQYLPRLEKQTFGDYFAYLNRASFFNATDRTVEALNGALFMKNPAFDGPDELKTLLDTIGPDQESFLHIMTMAGEEVLTVGRAGLLVDQGSEPGSSPYVASYAAESIINWRTEFVPSMGRRMLSLVVLQETEQVFDDEFEPENLTIYRVLRLSDINGDGKPLYTQEVVEAVDIKDAQSGQITGTEFSSRGTVVPKRKGGIPLEYIPFVFINPNSISDGVEKSPILDLVNVNLSHFRTSADLEHGRHLTSLPTPYIIGSTKAVGELYLGSQTAWKLPEKCSAGFLEFTGAGLGSLSQAKEEKAAEMAILGSRLLEPQKKDAESAEAVRLRLSGEGSVLSGISVSLSTGGTEIVRIVAEWNGISGADTATYVVNMDFTSALLSPQDQISFMAQVQAGYYTYEDYFDIMKRARLIPDSRTIDQQKQMILDFKNFQNQLNPPDVNNPNSANVLNNNNLPKDKRLNPAGDLKPNPITSQQPNPTNQSIAKLDTFADSEAFRVHS